MSIKTRSRVTITPPYENLRMLRLKRNLTMKDMGDVVGITEASYLAKENGVRDFKATELRKISKYFGESADAIFFT